MIFHREDDLKCFKLFAAPTGTLQKELIAFLIPLSSHSAVLYWKSANLIDSHVVSFSQMDDY